ncbi:MAG: glycosyltransferase [Archangium sp.]|nr:glycosyltransferase [Archangium sp.]
MRRSRRTFTTIATLYTTRVEGAFPPVSSALPALPENLRGKRVTLVHDWLLTWRGGEKVLEAMAELFPDAPIYTLFHDPKGMPQSIESHRIVTSLLDRIPGARDRHRHFLPLMPGAARLLALPDSELVLSSSHCVAKGVRAPKGSTHVSYVHAPLRYMWDRYDDYFGPHSGASTPVRVAARVTRPFLRAWDVATSWSVDRFLANSAHVAKQIEQRYHRAARVIHPPVELERFTTSSLEGTGEGGYFLCLGALAPYKRIDLAIEAFRKTGRELWIAGSGQSADWLRDLPPNVKALGQVTDGAMNELYRNARALIFPGVEDFGITPLEAQACGRPVIAFAGGGALETVTDETGLFFKEQTVDALITALAEFDAFEAGFEPAHARAQAQRFSRTAFQKTLLAELSASVP